jgi:tetratricopeptide (TPR) repeat protein
MTTDNDKPPPLAKLEAAVHRSPGDVGAWRELADAYCAADMFALALELLEHAVRIAPRDAGTRQFLAIVLREVGRPRDAIPHLQEALRLDPDNPASLTSDLGAAFDEAGDHAEAATHLRKAVELRPALGGAWLRLGWVLVAGGRYAEVIEAFDTASRYRPRSAYLWHGLGIAYARTGQHEKAVQAYRLSLRKDPARLEVLFDLDASCRRLGRVNEAEATMASGIAGGA